MSNPGVIKLAEKQIGNHHMWIDDNIGESIHIHYDQFRIELTLEEFKKIADSARSIICELIGFDIRGIDERFLFNQIDDLVNVKDIQEIRVKLSELRVFDDDGICDLPECDRVNALEERIDINTKKSRTTNYYGQTNADRLKKNLHFMREHKYPEESGFIYIMSDRNLILDGWHRAACLYYLNGDMEVPVKSMTFETIPYYAKRVIPVAKLCRDYRIVLYGAGDNGTNYFRQLMDKNYNVVGWWDAKAGEIEERCNYSISLPFSIPLDQYDCVVVSVMDDKSSKEIKERLLKNGVQQERIYM